MQYLRKTINIPKTLKIENSTKYKIKSTNSECDNIENYYIIKELNEDTKKFIKDLIRKHQDKKKEDQLLVNLLCIGTI